MIYSTAENYAQILAAQDINDALWVKCMPLFKTEVCGGRSPAGIDLIDQVDLEGLSIHEWITHVYP